MWSKINLLFNTLKYLKSIQVFYQFKYRIQKPRKLVAYNKSYNKVNYLSFIELPPVLVSYFGNNEFEFLNAKKEFQKGINWDFQGNGKLWNYNLQYLNYLLQVDFPFKEKESLILSLYKWLDNGNLPLEPYPVSLRIINIIRLFSNERNENKFIFSHLHAELDFLSKRPEYHLLGNHLLENAFALIMGGAFFSNRKWINQGSEILTKELEEQILEDGAHFELSPMYHQIIFFRLLELLDWYSDWEQKEKDFEQYLIQKAEVMCAFLENISFKNGDIPHFNDSTDNIAYSTNWLINYARRLKINSSERKLGASGYRSYRKNYYECKVDVAPIGAMYQPGHAHADAFSFVLYYNNQPLFVEKGTSTYEIGTVRSSERSSSAHNTVVVNEENQSQVWSGFRVAKRAEVNILSEHSNQIEATHNGYIKYGIKHTRNFRFEENFILIEDSAVGNPGAKKEFHLHFFPNTIFTLKKNKVIITGKAELDFVGAISIKEEKYQMANDFNKYSPAKKLVVEFKETLTTRIVFKSLQH